MSAWRLPQKAICLESYMRAHKFSDIIVILGNGSAARLTPSTSSWSCPPHEPKVGLFPLTLALSPREREQLSTCCEHSSESRFISAPPMVLPLPGGEGGVRGKATLEIRSNSTVKQPTPLSNTAAPRAASLD
jgi:hypothetical protein